MITPEEKERTLTKLEDPTIIADVCAYVSCGNSLIDLCTIWEVTYFVVSAWLYKHHKEAYEAAICTRSEWMVTRVLDEIKSIALVDIRQAYDDNGKLKDPKDWPDVLARCISSVESKEIEFDGEVIGQTKKIKLIDKLKALELLGKNLKLFGDDKKVGDTKILVFQHLSDEKLAEIPVEERIAQIESTLRGQDKQ